MGRTILWCRGASPWMNPQNGLPLKCGAYYEPTEGRVAFCGMSRKIQSQESAIKPGHRHILYLPAQHLRMTREVSPSISMVKSASMRLRKAPLLHSHQSEAGHAKCPSTLARLLGTSQRNLVIRRAQRRGKRSGATCTTFAWMPPLPSLRPRTSVMMLGSSRLLQRVNLTAPRMTMSGASH